MGFATCTECDAPIIVKSPIHKKITNTFTYSSIKKPSTSVIPKNEFFSLTENSQDNIKEVMEKGIPPKKSTIYTSKSLDMPIEKCNTLKDEYKVLLANSDNLSLSSSNIVVERKGNYETKYETEYILGIGTYGEVRKVRDICTNEIRAIKVISKKKCTIIDTTNEEIEIMKHLV